MNGGKKPQGYTIVEVMLFLAITGAMLVSALMVFRGQQARTQFSQAVRETDARLRTIMNEVASGYYPNSGGFRCVRGAGGVSFLPGNSAQGTNEDCVFLGKIVHFGTSSATCTDTSPDRCSSYRVYVLAGLRTNSSAQEVTTLTQAQPTLVLQTTSGQPINLSETFGVSGGLSIKKVVTTPRSGAAFEGGAIGFVSSLASYQADSEDPVSGSQSVTLVSVPGTALGQSEADLSIDVSNLTDAHRSPRAVTVCLHEGDGGREAAIKFGNRGRQLATDTFIDNVPTECD